MLRFSSVFFFFFLFVTVVWLGLLGVREVGSRGLARRLDIDTCQPGVFLVVVPPFWCLLFHRVPACCAVNPTHPVVCFGGVLLGCVSIVIQHLYYNLTLCFHVGVGGGAKRGF